jgi:hypothetical protein
MRHIKEYNQLFENQQELSQEQIEWLDRCAMGRWTLNPQTGLVDVKGIFNCYYQRLTDFKGVRFGVVTESFYCNNNDLTSLEGAPQQVGGGFYCNNNDLTSLGGAPQQVEGSFDCANNQLTSLMGALQAVVGNFDCANNQLTSLMGAPQKVGRNFYCANNQLTSLMGAPQAVDGNFDCEGNQLISPVGAPQRVRGSFYCGGNPVSETTLKAIFALMRNGKTYQQALEEYWPNMGDEDRVLMYKQMPNLPPEDARTYKALATYANIKGYL